MVDIYITSWRRPNFLCNTLDKIKNRTEEGTYNLHIYDNNSDRGTQKFLMDLLFLDEITSLTLDSRNTGCLYNKAVFHAMTESDSPYYVVTDNDVYPPKLDPDWLKRMVATMDKHPDLAFLSPQLPPVFLQEPLMVKDDIVYCKAVGNTFKMVRREAFPFGEYKQSLEKYGDDGLVSKLVYEKGWRVAFCRDIFCFHAGQCENWGYKPEEIHLDPRKSGYGKPFTYEVENEDTYKPVDSRLRL